VRKRNGKVEYLVKWEGYSNIFNSWEEASNMKCPGGYYIAMVHKYQRNIKHCSELIEEFERKQREDKEMEIEEQFGINIDESRQRDQNEDQSNCSLRATIEDQPRSAKKMKYKKGDHQNVHETNKEFDSVSSMDDSDEEKQKDMEIESKDEEESSEEDNSDDKEYAVEKILKKRERYIIVHPILQLIIFFYFRNGIVQYYVKWEGYSTFQCTWVNEENMNCDELIKEFEENLDSNKRQFQCKLANI
jgi:hypothetical protein